MILPIDFADKKCGNVPFCPSFMRSFSIFFLLTPVKTMPFGGRFEYLCYLLMRSHHIHTSFNFYTAYFQWHFPFTWVAYVLCFLVSFLLHMSPILLANLAANCFYLFMVELISYRTMGIENGRCEINSEVSFSSNTLFFIVIVALEHSPS